MPEAIVYDIQTPGLERMIEALGLASAGAVKLEADIKAMSDAARAFSVAQKTAATEQEKSRASAEKTAQAAEKAALKAAEAAEKRAQKDRESAEAMAAAADRAELVASRVATEGSRAYQTLIKVGGEYGQMLRDGVKDTSELAKTWRAGLSPAERTALNIAKVAATTSDAAAESRSFGLAVANATEKLADQIRRQDENVGANNKLSRSLSTIIKEQTNALTYAQIYTDQVGANTEALRKSAAQYDENAKKLDSLEKAMSALGIPGAGLVGTAKNLNESFKSMAEQGSVAQAGMLKLGTAVGAVGAAGAAAVAGVAAIGAAIVAVTAQAADWNAELKDVGLSVDQAPLERYAASIASVGNVAKAFGVQLATVFGPAVEAVATRIAALGLAGVDAFKNLMKGQDVMTLLARTAATVLVEAFTLPVTALQKLNETLAKPLEYMAMLPGQIGVTAKALSAMGTAATAVGGSIDAWKADQIDAVSASIRMLGNDAITPLIAVTNDYMGAAEKLVTRQTAVNAAAREGAKAAKAQATAMSELTIAARDSITTIGESVPTAFRQAQTSMGTITDDMIKASNDASKAIAENMARQAEAGRQSWTGSFSSIGQSAGALSELIIGFSNKQGDAAHKAAVIAFRIQQGAGLVSVAISTAQAIMQALANMPPPASYVAAGAAALAGVTQAATILSQSPPSASGATGASMPSAPSAPSMATASAGPSGATAVKAEQMTGMGSVARADTELSSPSAVQVTDAYIAPSSSSMSIRTTPGDAVSIERGGSKAERDGRLLQMMQMLVDETRAQGRVIRDLVSELQMGRHRRETSIGAAW